MRVQLFGEITKTEKQDDGTLIVSGIVSSECVDGAGDVMSAAAMKAAIPAYMRFGAVREMHSNIAAGTALYMGTRADGKTEIKTHIVDAGSVKKVETEVLKGFSVGGRIPKGGRNAINKSLIEKFSLTEISLVDRPLNPEAVIEIVKFADGAPVAKGMYHLGWAADLLCSIDCLQKDAEWEKQFEGDDSAIPARLKALVSELADIVRAIAAEETSEITSAAKASSTGAEGVLAMNEQQLAELVTKTVEAAVTKAMAAKPVESAAVVAEPVAKAAAPAPEPKKLAITLDESAETITKLQGANDELKKSHDALAKTVADMQAASKTKGVLKAVGKAEDVTKASGADDGEPKTAFDSIKRVHKSGGEPYLAAIGLA